MEADDLTIFDVESAILRRRIVERQRDRDMQEVKCRALSIKGIEAVVKLSATGKMVVVTVYRD